MKSYIARQPILNQTGSVCAYELLYRSGDVKTANVQNNHEEQNNATKTVISNALSVFGLNNLTNGKRAYINFPEQLLMDDTALLLKQQQVMIEILENVHVTEKLVQQVEKLKKKQYCFALDDYTGDPSFAPLMPHLNVIKVDFRATNAVEQARIAKQIADRGPILLAEKVEDEATFLRAKKQGYRLFQGYYFQKPLTLASETPKVNELSLLQLFDELNQPEADLLTCASIIRTDAYLTYQLLKSASTMAYYRGNSIRAIEYAVAYLGIDALRRWAMLVFGRGMNRTHSDETVREAYLRGVFAERLMGASRAYRDQKGEGFLLGMFSLMDCIMDKKIENLVEEISLPTEVKKCLLGKGSTFYTALYVFVTGYEKMPDQLPPELSEQISPETVSDLYVQSIAETDRSFNSIELQC